MTFDIKSVSTYVFDLDGVIYLGDQIIPGAQTTVNQLMSLKKNVYFLTNNSSVTRLDYVHKLHRMGIVVELSQIYTSAFATASYLKGSGASGSHAFVIGESGIQQEIESVGVKVFTEPNSISVDQVDYVVVGIDRTFSYEKLNFGHQCLVKGHAQFISTNRDSTYPSETGSVPGAGSLVISLANSSGQEPVNIGKPSPTALLEIIAAANTSKDATLMVGDRLDTDIACGNRAGTRSALVLTGVTPAEAVLDVSEDERPTFVIGSLTELL
jgi:4-nitrophenyl phosphatase